MQSSAKQVSKQSKQDASEAWAPARGSGIRFFEDHSRPSPYFAQWRDPDAPPGSRRYKTLSFRVASDRERFAKQKLSDLATLGPSALSSADPAKLALWRKFEEIVGGPHIDPLQVAFEWRQARNGNTAGTARLTVAELVNRYHSARARDGKSIEAIRHQRLHHKTLSAFFGTQAIAEISPDLIRKWLGSLLNSKTGEPITSPVTLRDYRKSAASLFEFAANNGLILRNPVRAVHPPTVIKDAIEILTVEQTAQLFAANLNQPIIGRLALEAFAGFRYSSAARCQASHINFSDKGVELPASLHKSRRRKYVEGHPANLWAWLNHAPASCWAVSERNYLKLKADAFTRAGIVNPGNALRKGFCTYHLAAYQDATKTAFLLQHRSPTMLYQEYNGVAVKASGLRYFTVTPSTCAEMARQTLPTPPPG